MCGIAAASEEGMRKAVTSATDLVIWLDIKLNLLAREGADSA